MRARLFPATTQDPRTAFSFAVLKQFHLHNLESKKAAYDYLGALRRLTDNAFTADVSVGFESLQFLCLNNRIAIEPLRIVPSSCPNLEVYGT